MPTWWRTDFVNFTTWWPVSVFIPVMVKVDLAFDTRLTASIQVRLPFRLSAAVTSAGPATLR